MNDSKKSWDIKDEAVCAELLVLMNISDAEKAAMKAMRPAAEAKAAEMVAEFHGRLTANENTKEYFANADINRVGAMVSMWFTDLFSGQYDTAYASKRIVIGQTHVKIGLPVRYPLAMLDIISKHAEAICAAAADPDLARNAFRKVLSLDVAIFNQAYEDNQLKHLSELVGGERLARRLLAGQS